MKCFFFWARFVRRASKMPEQSQISTRLISFGKRSSDAQGEKGGDSCFCPSIGIVGLVARRALPNGSSEAEWTSPSGSEAFRGGRQMFSGRALPRGQSRSRPNNPNVPGESDGMGKRRAGHAGFGRRPGAGQQPAPLTHYRHAPHLFVNDFAPADARDRALRRGFPKPSRQMPRHRPGPRAYCIAERKKCILENALIHYRTEKCF